MATRQIHYISDPVLEQRSKKVTVFDDKLKELVNDMLETMHARLGVGLSACQIGVSLRVVVIHYESDFEDEEKIPLTVLINPKITNYSNETDTADEGCLSLPGVELPVERPKKITVLAQDINGERFKVRASGLLARVIQHECDHLDGHLFVEKTNINFEFKKKINLVFFGTPNFALPALETFHENPMFNVQAIVTEPDKPSGRGMDITISPIKKFALDRKISILQPTYIRAKKDGTGKEEADKFYKKMAEYKPDFCLVAAYGKIIPKNILDLPKHGFVNIHPSLLPKYRGPTPLQATILNGDKVTGITIIKMDEGMDTGPIIAKAEIELPPLIDLSHLSEETAKIGAEIALFSVFKYLVGIIKPQEQKGEASITKMISKEDGYVDLQKDKPVEIERKIRAYRPWPGVYTYTKEKASSSNDKPKQKIIKITAAHIEKGQLVIDRVKPEGKNEMDYKSYLLGNPPLI